MRGPYPMDLLELQTDAHHMTIPAALVYVNILASMWNTSDLRVSGDLDSLAESMGVDAFRFQEYLWPQMSHLFYQTDTGLTSPRLLDRAGLTVPGGFVYEKT